MPLNIRAFVATDVLRQAVRFGVVGGSSYVINLSLYALALFLGLHYLAAAATSFLIGFTFNFLANRHWTFGVGGNRVQAQLARFSVVAALILGLDLVLLRIAVQSVGLSEVIGQGVVMVFLAPVSFLGNRLWSFGAGPQARLADDNQTD